MTPFVVDEAVGVKVAVYTVELVEAKPDKTPPVVVTSLAAKVDEPSERVNVIVAVWPVMSDARELVMVTVGMM
jgi:hypothetical protein